MIRLRPLGNAPCVACLPFFCEGSKWLNGKRVWLVFRASSVRSQLGPSFFLHGFYFTLQPKSITQECLLSIPINNIKPLCNAQVSISLIDKLFIIVHRTIPRGKWSIQKSKPAIRDILWYNDDVILIWVANTYFASVACTGILDLLCTLRVAVDFSIGICE